MEYEILRYRPDFLPGIATLQQHLWGNSPAANADYLEWKHLLNPFVTEPLVYVVLHAGSVVAMRGLYGAQWEFGESGDTAFVPCASDTVIAPAHRNQGLFARLTATALADLAAAGHAYVLNLSAGPTTLLACLATGWCNAGSLSLLSRRSRPVRVRDKLRRLLRRRRPDLDDRFAARYRALRRRRDPFRSLDREAPRQGGVRFGTEPRPAEMAGLALRGRANRIRHVRNEAFYSWRFANPGARYRFLFHAGSRLDGYMVLQASPSSGTVRIVDWAGVDENVEGELLRVAIERGRFDRISIWSATLSAAARKLLQDSGFEGEPALSVRDDRAVLLARHVRDGIPREEWKLGAYPILSLASWQLHMIDCDGY